MRNAVSVLLCLVIISFGGQCFAAKAHRLKRAKAYADSSAQEAVVMSELVWANHGTRPSALSIRPVSKKERTVYSPDKTLSATITTYGYVVPLGGGVVTHTSESTIQIRTSKGKLISSRSFVTRNHTTGLEIDNVLWTKDSQYLVFDGTIQLGHQPGHVPTYFFSREARKIYALDPLVGIWVTGGFTLRSHDSITIMVRDRLPHGGFSDTLVKTVGLRSLLKKR